MTIGRLYPFWGMGSLCLWDAWASTYGVLAFVVKYSGWFQFRVRHHIGDCTILAYLANFRPKFYGYNLPKQLWKLNLGLKDCWTNFKNAYLVVTSKVQTISVADPGFPVGGVDPLGGVDLRWGCFSVKMYAKTKELRLVGGRVVRRKFLYVDPPLNVGKIKKVQGSTVRNSNNFFLFRFLHNFPVKKSCAQSIRWKYCIWHAVCAHYVTNLLSITSIIAHRHPLGKFTSHSSQNIEKVYF